MKHWYERAGTTGLSFTSVDEGGSPPMKNWYERAGRTGLSFTSVEEGVYPR